MNTSDAFLAMIGFPELVILFVLFGGMVILLGAAIGAGIWLSRRTGSSIPISPTPETAVAPSAAPPSTLHAAEPTATVTSSGPAPAANAGGACPRCGAPLSTDAPLGLCPKCLLEVGIGTQPTSPGTTPGATAPPPDPAELERHFPNLEILERIGQGGMGIVYKARQKNLDRVVALKILPREAARDPAFAERFHREARTLARLNHPSIVGVHEFGEIDGLFFLLMEYVDGADLRRVLHERRLTPAEALRLVPAICDALQYAHGQGVVHRDIKPGNILIDRAGNVKIADFGIAKLLGTETTDITLTEARQTIGTLHYMAPEQVENPQAVDHRADIYSLGVVLYEMLTGELPIGRFSPPSRKVELDVRLDEVVLRALEKEPARRYQQAGDVKTEVERIRTAPAGTSAMPAGISSAPRSTLAFRSKIALAWLWAGAFLFQLIVWAVRAMTPGVAEGLPVALKVVLALVTVVGLAALLAPMGCTFLGLLAVRDIRSGRAPARSLSPALFTTVAFPFLTLTALVLLFWTLGMLVVTGGRKLELISLLGLTVVTLGGLAAWRGGRAWNGLRRWAESQPADAAVARRGNWIPALLLSSQTAVVLLLVLGFLRTTMDRNPSGPMMAVGNPPVVVPAMNGGWDLTAAGPVISEDLTAQVLPLVPFRERLKLNHALQSAYERYTEALTRNLSRMTNAEGHVVVRVDAFPTTLDQIESDFWTAADEILDTPQQSELRRHLLLRRSSLNPVFLLGQRSLPIFRDAALFPEMNSENLWGIDLPVFLFRFGGHPFAFEYWKVGSWYTWRVSKRDATAGGEGEFEGLGYHGPQLPEELSRLDTLSAPKEVGP